MKLDCVTITGADNTTDHDELARLAEKFPFVEFGILVSTSHVSVPRFPNLPWMNRLRQIRVNDKPLNLSLHVCGSWIRQLFKGKQLPEDVIEGFQRIQLNFHRETVEVWEKVFIDRLSELDRPIIFQIDGSKGSSYYEMARKADVDTAPLFDTSGGAGVLPGNWPMAYPYTYCGYAGGLSPKNLETQLEVIADAANEQLFWIDVETRVRTQDDQRLDIAKVERFLEIASKYITKESADEGLA